MNNTKEEFIMLMKFRDSIESKIKQLDKLQPESKVDKLVVDSQYFSYRAIIWEINSFIEELADEDSRFNYISWDNENI